MASHDRTYNEGHKKECVEVRRHEQHAEQGGISCGNQNAKHNTCLYLILVAVQETLYTADCSN